MMVEGRGRWAVSQKPKLIQVFLKKKLLKTVSNMYLKESKSKEKQFKYSSGNQVASVVSTKRITALNTFLSLANVTLDVFRNVVVIL